MTESQGFALLWSIVKTSGATVGILIVVGWLAKDYLRELLVGTVKRSYDEDLEHLRSELRRATEEALERLKHSNEQQMRAEAAIIASAAAGQTAALGHRLESIQGLWNDMVGLRRAIPTPVSMTDYLTHDELITELEKSLSLQQQVALEHVTSIFPLDADKFRLGAGEELWSLFYLYRAFIGRTAALFEMQLAGKREEKGSWKTDRWIRQLAATVLSRDQFERFNQHEVGGLSLTLEAIEAKFVSGAAQLMSGQLTAGEMTVTAQKIRDAINQRPTNDHAVR